MTIVEMQALLTAYSAQYGPGMPLYMEVFNDATGTIDRYDIKVETALAAPVSLVLRPVGSPVLVRG